jgi:hypothetical protein
MAPDTVNQQSQKPPKEPIPQPTEGRSDAAPQDRTSLFFRLLPPEIRATIYDMACDEIQGICSGLTPEKRIRARLCGSRSTILTAFLVIHGNGAQAHKKTGSLL